MQIGVLSGRDLCALILQRLGYQPFCQIISVAGTNGKGTSCHLLAEYLQKTGHHVGLFTSPHLLEFNERIVIDGRKVTEEELALARAKIRAVQGDLELGYFQEAFLAAILIFQSAKVDVMILEVGIGGRLDAVNSVDADYALITTIALDHTELLGPDRESIGLEKAGILRAHQQAVCGDIAPPHSLCDYAKRVGARLLIRGRDFDLSQISAYPEAHIPRQNVLAVWQLLQLWPQPFDGGVFAKCLQHLHVPGRMQLIGTEPDILIDVAHNPHAAGYLADYLRAHPVSGKNFAVFSALKEKDIAAVCKVLHGLIDHWFLVELDSPRAASFGQLHQALTGEIYTDFASMIALNQTLKKVKKTDRVIVFGSFVLVGLFLECHNQ